MVGTLYCLTNRTQGRLSNVTVQRQGGAFIGSASSAKDATRKGLGIVATDGFNVIQLSNVTGRITQGRPVAR